MKVSVVISAYNEEAKIEECLNSVKKIATEIIFVDNCSTDKTVQIAGKYTNKIFSRENNIMLNINKNYGFTKATSDWILSLDADERVTEELSEEILALNEISVSGYYIPRKNIIFGKWIQHTGWYPDYQLRLFKRENGKFAEKHVHEELTLEGTKERLISPLLHMNYENVSQFLNKMIKTYTVSEADNKIREGYKYNSLDVIKMPISEFVKRYFAEKGYKDGMHGFILSLLQAFYHYVVFLRLWEANNYPEEKDTKSLLAEGGRLARHEFGYWIGHEKISNEKNPLKKQFYRIKRKVLS
ncbi:MAG: glycosyltransferase family 2 protein [Candidatus Levybacteria bacterium]|nr:glycosyltransferase family 2 protein [Candidatus Levybacteria bacterium]